MAITHATATRNALCQAITDAVDAGVSNGYIEIQTSGGVEVATLPMSTPPFGAPASGVITANTITDDTNATGGTAGKFVVYDSDANAVYEGSVTLSGGGGDMILNSLTITAGDTVEVTSLTYTASV